jgi:hypothetical protein
MAVQHGLIVVASTTCGRTGFIVKLALEVSTKKSGIKHRVGKPRSKMKPTGAKKTKKFELMF